MSVRFSIAAAILILPSAATCASFTSKLGSDTIAAWDKYVERAEPEIPTRPMLGAGIVKPVLVDLNPAGSNAGQDVPHGYIHHWIAASRVPNTTVSMVRATLENYNQYPQVYPDVKIASSQKNSAGGYDVRLISEQSEAILHFAFDMRFHVTFRTEGDYTLVESRSYQIRESDKGHAPYLDLLPEGEDHGVVWRLNSYWRLKQEGSSVYAECQVISLSRKPLFGTTGRVKSRARESLETTLRRTLGK
jgi:hypothetical protein